MSKQTTPISYTGKKEPNTFTVTVWGSANDGIEEKYKKEAFLVGFRIAKADDEARKYGRTIEFCNGGTGHGCMKWSAVGYLMGGGRKLYGINTEEISRQEETGIVGDFITHAKRDPEPRSAYDPLCVIHDLPKTVSREDIEQIQKWEQEDKKQYLPDEIHLDLIHANESRNLEPRKEYWEIGSYDLTIWPEIQLRMLEMIHRADELVVLAGGMGSKQETNRAIVDILFDGTLTEGMGITFGGMGHWDPFINYMEEEFPMLYAKYLNGKQEDSRLKVFKTPEQFRDLLLTAIALTDFEIQKPSFPDYLRSRAGSEISLRLTTGPGISSKPPCFYTGIFHNQGFEKDQNGIGLLQELGYPVLKLPKIRNKPDFPNELALYVKEAMAHVTRAGGFVILSLDPIGSDLKRIERRRLVQDYVHDSVFVGQQVNEPRGFQNIPVYLILPPEIETQGFLDSHDVVSLLRHIHQPPHTKQNMTVIEGLMRENRFIRQAEGVVYQRVESVQEAITLFQAKLHGLPDPRADLKAIMKDSTTRHATAR